MEKLIKNKIDGIIAARKSSLAVVDTGLSRLAEVKSCLSEFEGLLENISSQLKNGEGEYYQLMAEDPTMKARVEKISTGVLRELIATQEDKLGLLKKRFSRNSVQIAFVGYERQGKSTFIQSITDLDNDVIPAYSGTSCTGAVSVIHNWEKDDFEAVIEFYSEQEMVEIINDKLTKKFFPGMGIHISKIADLKHLSLPDTPNPGSTNSALIMTEYVKFLSTFIEHVNEYEKFINSPTLNSHNKNEVAEYVSQYRMFETPPASAYEEVKGYEGEILYKKYQYAYIVVKSVNIFCKFNYPGCGNIVLVDTVGLGDSSDNAKIEDEMFRVLREDCDGAIDLFKPAGLGDSFNASQVGVLDNITLHIGNRNPEEWLVYVLNKVLSNHGYNGEIVDSIYNDARKALDKSHQVAWVKCINGIDKDEVRNELVIPLLELISCNLPNIDSRLMIDARESGEELYQRYVTFCESVCSVLSSSLKNDINSGNLFENLFKGLKLTNELGKLDENIYGPNRNTQCQEVKQNIIDLCENIFDLVPSDEEIRMEVEKRILSSAAIYEKMCNIFRNRIFDNFEELNTGVLYPLQEQVKEDIATVLFEHGLMGRVPLKKSFDIPSVAWLSQFIDDKLARGDNPRLLDAFRFVLDYKISIEGMVEYNIAKSLYNIDPMNEQFEPLPPGNYRTIEEHVDVIEQQLNNSVPQIQRRINGWCDEFSLIPSHSFYARVHKFREKLVFSEDGQDDIRSFYRDNAPAIWSQEFINAACVGQAFGKWNDFNNKFQSMCKEEYFVLK